MFVTSSTGTSTPKSPRATMIPSDASKISSKFLTPSVLSILAMILGGRWSAGQCICFVWVGGWFECLLVYKEWVGGWTTDLHLFSQVSPNVLNILGFAHERSGDEVNIVFDAKG